MIFCIYAMYLKLVNSKSMFDVDCGEREEEPSELENDSFDNEKIDSLYIDTICFSVVKICYGIVW
jgi:hypothetical protein